MTDTREDSSRSPNFTPIAGFALGALVGAGIALLLAPASGERTRRRLGNTARSMIRDARHTIDEAHDAVTGAASDLGADVASAISAGREAFLDDGKPRDPRPTSRIALTPEPPSRGTS